MIMPADDILLLRLHACRHRVQVSATSKLVPVAHAAEIRPGSKGNLLRQLLSANVDADLYGKELVRAVINVGHVH